MAREYLMVLRETAYDTPDLTTGAPTTGSFHHIRLSQDASFTVEADPVQLPIMTGGGTATEYETVSDEVNVAGEFATLLYPTQAATLLGWAITPINSGRTTPWTTTDASGVMPVGDLASLSFYHAYVMDDGTTYKRTRYGGCKCTRWSLSVSEQSRMVIFRASLIAKRPVGNAWDSSTDPDATEFPFPTAQTDYASGPYTLGHLATGTGTAKIGSERKATTISLEITGENKIDVHRYTSRFITSARYTGRDTSARATLKLKATPDDRTAFRALTTQDSEFILDNATVATKLDFHARGILRPWRRNLPMAGEYMADLTLAGRVDNTQNTDLTLTVT